MSKWFLLILLILLVVFLFWREREQCPDPDQIWVMSDKGWVCMSRRVS